MTLVNGQPQNELAIGDRAIQYGDGCFTTICVENGKLEFWALHLERLQTTLQRLKITEPDWQQICLDAEKLASAYEQRGVVKILISRGSGGRGYSPQGCKDTQVIISDFPWPEHYLQWQQQGIHLGVCEQRMGYSPMLAGMKHLNRLEQVMLKQEAADKGWLDAVVLDSQDNVVETTSANLFWRKGSHVYSSGLSGAGVAGVMRRKVIDCLAETSYVLELGDFPLSHLLAAEEVFISNALMKLVPIIQIETTKFNEHTLFDILMKRLHLCQRS